MSKQIFWEKWIDPLGKNLDEVKWPDWKEPPNLDDILSSAASEDEMFDDELHPNESADADNVTFKGIVTSQGLFAITEVMFAGKLFNLWVGHTNWQLTTADVGYIKMAPGVELFQQFTPYRFRIAVARLFKSDEVKSSIAEYFANDERALGSTLG